MHLAGGMIAGGSRTGGDDSGGDNEVQRTMLQIVTELDGFDPRGNIKVLMATNRPDTLDPALLRPGRLDRKVGFLRRVVLVVGLYSRKAIVLHCCCQIGLLR